MPKRILIPVAKGRSSFFDNVLSLQIFWSPFHSSSTVAKEFIKRMLGAKFRRNNEGLDAEHFIYHENDRPALFRLHIGE